MTNGQASVHLQKHPVAVDGCLECLELAIVHDEARKAAGRVAAPGCAHARPMFGCIPCFERLLRELASDTAQRAVGDPPPDPFRSHIAGVLEAQRRPRDPEPVILSQEIEMAQAAKEAARSCAEAAAAAAAKLTTDPTQEGAGRLADIVTRASEAAQRLDHVGDKMLSR